MHPTGEPRPDAIRSQSSVPAHPQPDTAEHRRQTEIWANEGGGYCKLMRTLRILVVEDDALIGMLLAEMLEEMGHDVCAIEATEDGAISGAYHCQPDLMIVDVGLAEGNGISAVDRIQDRGPMPHVFVSGDISRVRLLRPGSVMVQKPFHEQELGRAIWRAFGPGGSL